MSCESACVVTDVGDSAIIVGSYGFITKPDDIEDLSNKLETMIHSDYKALGKKSRERILKNFSLKTMIKNTENEIIKCAE